MFIALCFFIFAACFFWRKQGYDAGFAKGYQNGCYNCMVAQAKKDQQEELVD